MFPAERQKKIIDLLMIKKTAKITDLAKELQVSIDTLRRDLNLLTKQKKIEKVYGGVKLVESAFGESVIDERMVSSLKEKESIARLCSHYIQDGDCIFLDSGSTTYQIAKFIKSKKRLTVVTNSFPVALELMNSDVEVIMIGGKVRKTEKSVVTYEYLFNFNELNISKAFICASGITPQKGISDYNLEEAITRKKMIELSKEVYVAADHSKFGKDVTVSVSPLDHIDVIVTDQNLDEKYREEFRECGTVVVLAEG
ncbi:DeoR/GlpR family DNA-binding transcription regulator [Cytobacillus firmus]|uniref:DeoR/GlpR family DNA-binding transcription regulator n=1 Tax=Cytobacillus firmus TaxID=1399 RepID=UPI002163F7AA|nr:DeoR/GlpR family DNA-binding transcription regulator [Cytobacillus firmus]MCS0671438.1 DeoR/GlpR family DNA-binding transcription regulator [Cytobacillus firmus]